MSRVLSRRRILKGAGVAMSLPLLDAMVGKDGNISAATSSKQKAQSSDKPAQLARLAVLTVPFGMVENKFHPTSTGKDYSLSETLQPLAKLKQDFTTFSNMDHDVRGGHSADHTFLSGVKLTERAAYRDGNITIDQRAAECFGHHTRFPSLNLWSQGKSYTRTGVRVPAIEKPSDLFKLLFINSTEAEKDSVKKSLANSGSILDTIQADAKSLNKELGKNDQLKMDEYFTSIRETEKKLNLAKNWVDQPKPQAPKSAAKIGEGARDEKLGGNLVEVWMDLMYLALRTDSTRVITAAVNNCNWGLPNVTMGYHTLSHHGRRDDKLGELKIVENYLMTHLARFIQQLKDTEELGGNMLDHTQVLFGSGLGSGNKHSNVNLPLILAGGKIKHQGHMDIQRKQPLCNLYLSMLQSMGCEVDYFNTSSGTLTGLSA